MNAIGLFTIGVVVTLIVVVFADEAAETEVAAASAAAPITIAAPTFFMSGSVSVAAAYAAGIRTRSMTWMTPFSASTSF